MTGVPARVQRVTHSTTRPLQNQFLFTIFPVPAVFTVTIMYTLNKVSTLLPLVLITSYCVGTSTYCEPATTTPSQQHRSNAAATTTTAPGVVLSPHIEGVFHKEEAKSITDFLEIWNL